MVEKREWDLKSTHSLEAYAEWLRVKADALIVVVIRPGDGALAVDPLIDVLDAHDRLWDRDLPKLLGRLLEIREEAKGVARRREAKGRG